MLHNIADARWDEFPSNHVLLATPTANCDRLDNGVTWQEVVYNATRTKLFQKDPQTNAYPTKETPLRMERANTRLTTFHKPEADFNWKRLDEIIQYLRGAGSTQI